MKELVAECSESIDVSMYSLTHDGLTQELIDHHKRGGVVIRVVVDHTQMHVKGSTARKLLQAGIALWVHKSPNFMMRDKFALFDRRILAHGSVN